MSELHRIFVYATLMDSGLVKKVIGRTPITINASAIDMQKVKVDGDYYTLTPKDTSTPGKVIFVTDEELTKLDKWESKYKRVSILTTVGSSYTYLYKKE